jgi:hypothetical protein
MSAETWDTLLHGHLQEGLKYEILKGPAVSGAQSVCLVAKNEEKRQAELHKRAQYRKNPQHKPPDKKSASSGSSGQSQQSEPAEDGPVQSMSRSSDATTAEGLGIYPDTAKRRRRAVVRAKVVDPLQLPKPLVLNRLIRTTP